MGIVDKILSAGLKKTSKAKPKMDIKAYQDNLAKKAAVTRITQLKELNTKLAKSKTPAGRIKLVNQIKHLKNLQIKYDKLPKGLGGKAMATQVKKGSRRLKGKAIKKGKLDQAMQSRDFISKGVGKQAKKTSKKKVIKEQTKRRKESEPTAGELIEQLENLSTFKKQAD